MGLSQKPGHHTRGLSRDGGLFGAVQSGPQEKDVVDVELLMDPGRLEIPLLVLGVQASLKASERLQEANSLSPPPTSSILLASSTEQGA